MCFFFKKDKAGKEFDASSKYFWHMVLFIFFPFLYLYLLVFIFDNDNYVPTDIPIFDLVILTLAIFRVTRLFVYDEITNFLRDFFAKWKNWLSKSLSELINCPWCTWIWVSLILTFMYYISPIFWTFLLILAMASIVSFLQVTYKLLARLWDSYKK